MYVLYVYAAPVEAGSLAGETARDAEFLELGIGKAASAATLTRRLGAEPTPGLVVLFGVCGTHHSIDVGELCLLTDDCLADEGVRTEDGFLDLASLGLPDHTRFRMDIDATALAARCLDHPAVVTGATVSSCSGNDADARAIATRTGAQVETMEGAAVALVCDAMRVPLVQLRCVSNRTGDRERGGFDLTGACARVQDAVRRMLAGSWSP